VNVYSVLEELLDHFIPAVPVADHVHVCLVNALAKASRKDGRTRTQVDICSLCNEEANYLGTGEETSIAKRGSAFEVQHVYICALFKEELDDVHIPELASNVKGSTAVERLCVYVCAFLEEKLDNAQVGILGRKNKKWRKALLTNPRVDVHPETKARLNML